MWAQLMQMQLKPGEDTEAMTKEIQAAEQPGSGLVRTLLMRDQDDPSTLYTLVVFESEEKARAREQDPRRQERLKTAREIMGEIFEGPPSFTDLDVVDEWTGEPVVTAGHDVTVSPSPPRRSSDRDEHPNAAVVRSLYDAVARGDMATFAGLLDDDIVWYESTPGFEGTYRGRDETLALLGRVFEEAGIEMGGISIEHVLADDDHAVVLHETTMTLDGRSQTAEYVDVYRVRGGRLTEHRHLPVDPKAEEAFFAG